MTQPGNAPKARPSYLMTRLTRTRLRRPQSPSPLKDADPELRHSMSTEGSSRFCTSILKGPIRKTVDCWVSFPTCQIISQAYHNVSKSSVFVISFRVNEWFWFLLWTSKPYEVKWKVTKCCPTSIRPIQPFRITGWLESPGLTVKEL